MPSSRFQMSGQKCKRVSNIDQAEEAEGGVGKDAVEGAAEAGPGQQDQGEDAEHRELGFDGAVVGDVEQQRGGGGHPPAGDAVRRRSWRGVRYS